MNICDIIAFVAFSTVLKSNDILFDRSRSLTLFQSVEIFAIRCIKNTLGMEQSPHVPCMILNEIWSVIIQILFKHLLLECETIFECVMLVVLFK